MNAGSVNRTGRGKTRISSSSAAYGEAFTETAKPHMIGAEALSSPEFSTANDGVAAIAKRKPTTVDSARKAELITIIPRLFGRP